MSDTKIECYILPSSPLPVLLPIECVAEVIKKPEIEILAKAAAKWMIGHVNWQNQRLPLMSFAPLLNSKLSEVNKKKPNLVVLNPIPDAARKAYSGLLCYGDVTKITVGKEIDFIDSEVDIDKRYVESIVHIGGKDFIIPKLSSLAVAFTYLS